MLAAIPYTTFPQIDLGVFTVRTFALAVGIGVVLGAWMATRYISSRTSLEPEEIYRMAAVLVVAGVVGARLSWDISHWDEINSPLDLIAAWKGGLQFSGGFAGAIVFGIPFFRRWDRSTRWVALDGYAYGLTIGLAIGRIGCYSVGEHFGGLTSFPLAVRYDGGSVRESRIGDVPLKPGMAFHSAALYEILILLVLFAVLSLLVRRTIRPATVMGAFCAAYGVSRFLLDFIRTNDETVLGLTGAQYLMAAIALASVWIFRWVRPALEAPGRQVLPPAVAR